MTEQRKLSDLMREGLTMTLPSRRTTTYGTAEDGKPKCCPIAAAAYALGWRPTSTRRMWRQVDHFLRSEGYNLWVMVEDEGYRQFLGRRIASMYDYGALVTREQVADAVEAWGY